MTYRELLRRGEEALRARDIADWKTDAWLLLEYACGLDRAHYFLESQEDCRKEAAAAYAKMLQKRGAYIPLQQITGTQAFMGYTFAVNPHVLIPRQDTELLVMEAEKYIRPGSRVLDLCTGSGCIIISLAKRNRILAHASDISEEALHTARENAKRLGADVTFFQSDLFANLHGGYDCIVSNPPYIESREMANLMPEVKDHEPRIALDGGADGLSFYRRIVREAEKHLARGGRILFEIGCSQAETVSALLRAAGYRNIEVKKDLSGLDRVVTGQR